MRHVQFDVRFLELLRTKRKVGWFSAVSEECLLTLKFTLLLYIIYKIQQM